jgi:hypothetical protein
MVEVIPHVKIPDNPIINKIIPSVLYPKINL